MRKATGDHSIILAVTPPHVPHKPVGLHGQYSQPGTGSLPTRLPARASRRVVSFQCAVQSRHQRNQEAGACDRRRHKRSRHVDCHMAYGYSRHCTAAAEHRAFLCSDAANSRSCGWQPVTCNCEFLRWQYQHGSATTTRRNERVKVASGFSDLCNVQADFG